MRRALHFWPALAVAAAAALALLAYGVLAAARDARSGAAPGMPARVGGALVGAGDDRDLRRALALVDAASRPRLSPGAAFKRRGLAETALARATQSGSVPARARAAHLFAVLSVRDAAADPANAQQYLAAAVGGFTTAIRLDPHDDASKYDLELLLSPNGKQPKRRDEGRGQGRGGTTSGHGRFQSGTGLGESGSGY